MAAERAGSGEQHHRAVAGPVRHGHLRALGGGQLPGRHRRRRHDGQPGLLALRIPAHGHLRPHSPGLRIQERPGAAAPLFAGCGPGRGYRSAAVAAAAPAWSSDVVGDGRRAADGRNGRRIFPHTHVGGTGAAGHYGHPGLDVRHAEHRASHGRLHRRQRPQHTPQPGTGLRCRNGLPRHRPGYGHRRLGRVPGGHTPGTTTA